MAIHPKTHHRQKVIGMLNSARIEEGANTKIKKNSFLNW
jgi:hypothetical protein